MLWVDQYRPNQLDEMDYHDEVTDRLKSLAKSPASLPHLFFYGPSGGGKRTRIAALLYELFGPSSTKLKLDQRTFTTPTKRQVELHMITSPHHVEMSPGDAGTNDRYVIQDVLKELASTKNIRSSVMNMSSTKEDNDDDDDDAMNVDNDDDDDDMIMDDNNINKKQLSSKKKHVRESEIKVVILNQVDRLSKQAQAALRRTMEKYATTCRLILCCDSPSKLIAPLRSRCLGIRISAPTIDQVSTVLKRIAKHENIDLSDTFAVNIARESNRNLRKAILMLEAAKVQAHNSKELKSDQLIPTTDWELYIRNLAKDITKEQSPQKLMTSREKLYELLVNCIPATTILKHLVLELLKYLDDSLKLEVLEWAAFYEHRIAQGSKEIFHLEAFIAKYMAIYKKYLNDLFG